jgi:hypothetical protein
VRFIGAVVVAAVVGALWLCSLRWRRFRGRTGCLRRSRGPVERSCWSLRTGVASGGYVPAGRCAAGRGGSAGRSDGLTPSASAASASHIPTLSERVFVMCGAG